MKKALAILLSLVMVVALFAACGGNSNNEAEPTGTSETPVTGNTEQINVCIASEPDHIDPALNSAVDGATLIAHLFSGLAKWDQKDDGSLEIVADAATELTEGVKNDDGTITYTYTLRDGLTWSDGQPVTANDFVFAWNRAASKELAADYGYMFEIVDGYEAMQKEDAPADAKLNAKAVDDKTIEVTLTTDVPYWNELLAFPTYFPVREDVVANEAWATDPSTLISNGPYKMTAWSHNSVITLEKNDNFIDADTITMKKINFYLSDDANNMLANFQNGDWQLIDDVPNNEIANLKESNPDEFKVTGQIGTYYVCWNINEDILPAGAEVEDAESAKEEIRSAIGLLFDRNYIVEEISKGGEVPASSFVAMGLTDADGSEFYKNAGTNDFDGYYDVSADAVQSNYDTAIETLKKYYDFDEATGKFTNFPTLTYLYNTNENHKAIGEYLQSALDGVGIKINLENQEWNTFLNTRKQGDFSIARNGWLADYNDPISFLDMWTSGSGNNDIQFGKGANKDLKHYSLDLTPFGMEEKVENGTWAETYDVLIAKIKTCTDTETRYKLMHVAEDMLMATGCICPLYFYTDLFMLSKNVNGFFSNPLGYKYFMYTSIAE